MFLQHGLTATARIGGAEQIQTFGMASFYASASASRQQHGGNDGIEQDWQAAGLDGHEGQESGGGVGTGSSEPTTGAYENDGSQYGDSAWDKGGYNHRGDGGQPRWSWNLMGQWYDTPQGWFWGRDLDSAIEYGIQRGWITVTRDFMCWWSARSELARAGASRGQAPSSSGDAVDGGEAEERSSTVGAVRGQFGEDRQSVAGHSSTKSGSAQDKKPNMGKDWIPTHDGSCSMREYERRVRLYQATCSIDPEYQAGRLVEKLQGDAWSAVETLDLTKLKCAEGVDLLLQHLWAEMEPLEYLRVMQTLSHFYRVFKRQKGEEFSHYDTAFRAQCLRLAEVGSAISGITKAYWFLEKSSISEDLRRQVIAAAGGQYDYERLRASLCAIVPQVRREQDDAKPPAARWHSQARATNKVNAVLEDEITHELEEGGPEEEEEGIEDQELSQEISELEAEAQILMTQAAKKRSEAMRNRGFNRPPESKEQRGARIEAMKARMSCAACKAHGKTVFGHWHGDPDCPYRNESAGSKDAGARKPQATFVVSQDDGGASDSSDDIFAVHLCNVAWQEQAVGQAVVMETSGTSSDLRRASDGLALSDTACARTVCGEKWLQHHMDRLEKMGIPVAIVPDEQPFKFGDGPRITSSFAAIIPLLVPGCKKMALLRSSVVPQDVPLLVSSPALKAMMSVLDLGNNKYVFKGLDGKTAMVTTPSGHIGFEIASGEHCRVASLMHWEWHEFIESHQEVMLEEDWVKHEHVGNNHQGSPNKNVVLKEGLDHASTTCPQPASSAAPSSCLACVIEADDGLGRRCQESSALEDGVRGSLVGNHEAQPRGSRSTECGEAEVAASRLESPSSSQGTPGKLEEVLQIGTGGTLCQPGNSLEQCGSQGPRVPRVEQGSVDRGAGTLSGGSPGVGHCVPGRAGSDHSEVRGVRSDDGQAHQQPLQGAVLGMPNVPQVPRSAQPDVQWHSSGNGPNADGKDHERESGSGSNQTVMGWCQEQARGLWRRYGWTHADQSLKDTSPRRCNEQPELVGTSGGTSDEGHPSRDGSHHGEAPAGEHELREAEWQARPLSQDVIGQRIKRGMEIRRRAKRGTWCRLLGNCKQLAACVFLITASSLACVYDGSCMMTQAVFGDKRPDLSEIFAGEAEVSMQFSRRGWFVMEPCDIVYGQDLREEGERERVMRIVKEQKPRLVLVSYPCKYWTALTNINFRTSQGRRRLEKLRRAERPFLQLCSDVFDEQIDRDDDALGENPRLSASFATPIMRKVLDHPKVDTVVGHGCRYGLKHPKTGLPLLKPTMWFGTSPEILGELAKQCQGNHEHAKCLGEVLLDMLLSTPLKLLGLFNVVLSRLSRGKILLGSADCF